MQQNEKTKKPYAKPEIKRFALRPDESVLGFCKSSTQTGTGGANACNSPAPCRTQGS